MTRAKRASNDRDYPDCVFHAQQCVEKAVKAMLEIRMIYSVEHDVLPHFLREFQEEWRSDFDLIAEALDFLYKEWALARYPRILRERVISPEEYTEEFAKDAVRRAECALKG